MDPEQRTSQPEPSTDETSEAVASEAVNEATDTATNTENETPTPSFGWNQYAERINGRFAMIGFVALLVLELITRQDFFTWLGL